MTALDGPLDAIVVGAGPNGLAAAITLARAGRSVRVYEAAPTAGGGARTAELTLPGFRHDVCSTIVPLAGASAFFATIDLAARGVELIHPDAPVAHPLDGGRAAVLERSVAATAEGLGETDGRAWRRTVRAARARRREARGGGPPAGHPPAAAPVDDGPLRAAGAALDPRAGREPVRGGRGARAVRRDLGAFDAAARATDERRRSGWSSRLTPMPSAGRWSAAASRA